MRREDCWCGEYRKPCTYHEGYEDGYDAAMTTPNEPYPSDEQVLTFIEPFIEPPLLKLLQEMAADTGRQVRKIVADGLRAQVADHVVQTKFGRRENFVQRSSDVST